MRTHLWYPRKSKLPGGEAGSREDGNEESHDIAELPRMKRAGSMVGAEAYLHPGSAQPTASGVYSGTTLA